MGPPLQACFVQELYLLETVVSISKGYTIHNQVIHVTHCFSHSLSLSLWSIRATSESCQRHPGLCHSSVRCCGRSQLHRNVSWPYMCHWMYQEALASQIKSVFVARLVFANWIPPSGETGLNVDCLD